VIDERAYQSRMITEIRHAILQGHRKILVVLPTGGGKSVVAARIMQMTASKGNTSAFFAAQRELVYQIGGQLGKLGLASRTIMSGEDDYIPLDSDGDDPLCSLIARDTLWARAFRREAIAPPEATVVQVDECHQSLCPTYQKIMSHYSDSIVIGWTATPCRSDNKPLGQYFDKLIVGASYKELQDLGFLVPVRVIAPDRPDLKGCKVSKGDYAKGDLQKRMNRDEMVGNIVKEWLKNADGRQTVAFAAGIDHSVHIRDLFRKEGVTAEHIDGKMPAEQRKEIMERAKDGKIRVLCNYGVLTTGVDIPGLKYMILARPTKSFGLFRQMSGRIQRPSSGHDHCVVQDHSDCCLVFGYPDEDVEWSLDGDDDVAKKHMERKAKEKDAEGKPKGDPYCCDKCHTAYRGYACPKCGHRPERAKALSMSDGELKELERSKANRLATPMEKQKFWDECLGWAVGTNKKVGAAAHRYKERYGVFPNSTIQNVPRSSQWQMKGQQFWNEVVKPERQTSDAVSKRYWGKSNVSGQ
jgi:DNA repair protein RadD